MVIPMSAASAAQEVDIGYIYMYIYRSTSSTFHPGIQKNPHRLGMFLNRPHHSHYILKDILKDIPLYPHDMLIISPQNSCFH